MKRSFATKAIGVMAAVMLLTVMSAAPAMAGTKAKSGGITGNGAMYHPTGNFHLTGALSLTQMTASGACGSGTGISLRQTSAAAAAATQVLSFYRTSISFRNLAAPPGYYYTFNQGTKWFTTEQWGADASCYSGWAGKFNYVG